MTVKSLENVCRLVVLTILLLQICAVSLQVQAGLSSCKRLSRPDYAYYGTKTLYNKAREFLAGRSGRGHKLDSDELPNSYDDESLREEHNDLLKDHCKPIMLYFVGRHAARFPDGEDIEQYNKNMLELQQRMRQANASNKCNEALAPILQWRPHWQPQQDNLITEVGAREQRDIARHLKSVFGSQFFDPSKADVTYGVTSKLRTAQTGAEFLKEFEGGGAHFVPACDDLNALPTNDVERADYDLNKILNNKCYESMMKNNFASFLEFHKVCEKLQGKQPKRKHPLIERARAARAVRVVAERVAAKLGLNESTEQTSAISNDLLNDLFDTCKLEDALLSNGSVWCSIFEKDDVRVLEFLEDVKDYFKDTYGPGANERQACPLIGHLVEQVQSATKMGPNDKVRAHFYFTHATPMKKLIAAFGLFTDDDVYNERMVQDFERRARVPKRRDWRSSLIAPFSANVAVTMYRCQKGNNKPKHKLLFSVNEQPVKLRACKRETDCDVDKFIDAFDNMRNCDMASVCAAGAAAAAAAAAAA